MTDTAREGANDTAAQERDLGRLDAFSDGVFAIAITLLVLTIQVPDPSSLGRRSLASALLHNWPVYVAYIVSFVFVLIMWVNHHNMFKAIARVDHGLLLFNGALLLFVTLVPFPTSLLAQYLDRRDAATAAAVYNGLFTAIAIVFNLLWRYIVTHPTLLRVRPDEATLASITQRYRFGPVLYFVALLVGFIYVRASIALSLGLAIYFALPHEPHEPHAMPQHDAIEALAQRNTEQGA